jgi:hypothetical protein
VREGAGNRLAIQETLKITSNFADSIYLTLGHACQKCPVPNDKKLRSASRKMRIRQDETLDGQSPRLQSAATSFDLGMKTP